MRSLLVVRHGRLIAEQYFGTVTADSLNDGRSVTKSITSLLVGIAISKKIITGTTERLDTLIHPPVAQITGAKAAITVDNLLTMTSGFEWDETEAGYDAWALAPDQIDYLLERPLSDQPGTRFNYNTAAVHLISAGLEEATGLTEEEFARRNLFPPLGITADAWETDDRGFNNGGAGLALRARDLAKIGQLVLQDGRSGETQVVPTEWIHRELAVHEHTGGAYGPVSNLDYGYLWWLTTADGHRVEFAWGFRGQYIVLVPDLDLVVVATGALDAPVDPDVEAQSILGVIMGGVLPAVRM